MFIDPEMALPFDDLMQLVWTRNPELYRRFMARGERNGQTYDEQLEDLADHAEYVLTPGSPQEKAFNERLRRKRLPFGPDPAGVTLQVTRRKAGDQ